MATLGIDFGTSNTAAGVMAGNQPFLIPVEPGETTLPTSVFFDFDRQMTLFGSTANAALIDGREGRFMRALKSVLGTSLMHERRQIGNNKLTLIDVVARFLSTVKERGEAATGLTFDTALSGRPVRFHSTDMDRNARAENDLRGAYMTAGFKDVSFMYEPEAAALTSGPLDRGKLGLIIDIGGGTSDFSLFERDGDATRIIASHGVRIGGTDFDRALSIAHVMPLLGRGLAIRNEIGPGQTTTPNALYNDLATWEKIAFLYTPETLRLAQRFRKLAVEPQPFARLVDVIEMETGHDIAFAVEKGKIAANTRDTGIDLSIIERDLRPTLTNADLTAALTKFSDGIADCARETLAMADVTPDRVSRIVFVGGSSLMGMIGDTMGALFPQAEQERTAAFTAVADGLAMAAARSPQTATA